MGELWSYNANLSLFDSVLVINDNQDIGYKQQCSQKQTCYVFAAVTSTAIIQTLVQLSQVNIFEAKEGAISSKNYQLTDICRYKKKPNKQNMKNGNLPYISILMLKIS